VGVPTVVLGGPQHLGRFTPRHVPHRLAHAGLYCEPCADGCTLGAPRCLTALTVERVMNAARGLLRRA